MSLKTPSAAPDTVAGPAAPRRSPRALLHIPHGGLVVVLVLVAVFTAVQADSFTTSQNLLNVLRQISVNAVIAAGLTLLMTAGGMDFSMGSNAAVTLSVAAQLLHDGWSTTAAVLVSLLLATLIGLVNGVVVTFTRVAPFVATLASAMLLDGVALLVLDGMSVTIGDRLTALGNDKILGIPYLTVVAVLVLAGVGLSMRFTTFGRDAYAMGGNEHVARLSGINVAGRKLALYALAGALAGLAGLMLLSRLGAAAPNTAGLMTQLTAVAAVVIGGTSLAGGHGSIVGTVLGAVLLGVVANALNLLQVDGNYQYVVTGGVLLVAAVVNEFQRRSSPGH
ncbi:ribose ABC transporter permease [Streptomyces sp. Act143]|uniref:ABC transporter permease n=1 Tax=Streptomyces sp. Act143 TaxID=2200760 RepID=UPI000D6724AC|nr:ABC transporter permease [Streptomyces sp. Act143]PWI13980.1 ribose ABC transporter permease [Streptomyces sp. Act143]